MLNLNSTTVLDHDQIRSKAPSIFTEQPLDTLSDKYVFIPTSRLLDDMESLGWQCVDAKEIKARKRKGFQKHLMIFKNSDLSIKGEDGDEVFPIIYASNSHDGTSCFVLRAGLFRLICENGLVISTTDFESLKIRHMGYNINELQNRVEYILERLPQTVEFMNKMVETKLNEAQAEKFAEEAIGIRFPGIPMKVNLKDLIKPIRPQDGEPSLWNIFNIVQEKLIHGDFIYELNNKTRKARPIKNFQQDILINEKLFNLALNQLN